jgi:hypothetical protein
MCFEVGGGMKHSQVRYEEGGEGDELSQAGRGSADKFSEENQTPPLHSAGIASHKIVYLL